MKTTLITALGFALLSSAGAHADHAHADHAHEEHAQAEHKMDHGAQMAAHDGAVYEIGALHIERPFSRASLPNQPVGGGFFTVTNTGSEDDRLIAASTSPERADHMEIHEMPSTGLPTHGSQGDVNQSRWGTHGDHAIIALTASNQIGRASCRERC